MDILTRLFDSITVRPRISSTYTADCLDRNGHAVFLQNDREDPKQWSLPIRTYITAVSMLMMFNATFASSAPTANIRGLMEHFDVSREAASLVTTLFLLGYVAGPLFWAPMSELYGRRWFFSTAMVGYIAFTFLCAFTPNFGGLLIGRFLGGTFISAVMSNAPAVAADLWSALPRGNVVAIFVMTTFAGPACGPVSSGFLELTENWRWTFYQLLWLAGPTFALCLTLPETYGPVILTLRAKRMRGHSGCEHARPPAMMESLTAKKVFHIALTRPWILLFDPLSFCSTVYMSFIYALLYMLFSVYPIIFQEQRGWNAGVGQLPFLALVIGSSVAGVIIFAETALVGKPRQLAGQPYRPEDRMRIGMIGAVTFAISLYWISWSGEYNSVHWIVPTIAGSFVAMSIGLLFFAMFCYLIDSYLVFAASVIAGNTICRSALGAATPLFTPQMYDAMGIGGAGSLLAGCATVMAPIPFMFYRYGEALRKRSKHASISTRPFGLPAPADEEKAADTNMNDRRVQTEAVNGLAMHHVTFEEDDLEVEDKDEERKRESDASQSSTINVADMQSRLHMHWSRYGSA